VLSEGVGVGGGGGDDVSVQAVMKVYNG
jgi:hypothetical protein